MLYFDERGVSRKYGVTLSNNTWNWWRNAPGFSQRFTGTIADDGRTIVGRGELSKDGVTWEGDLALTCIRGRSDRHFTVAAFRSFHAHLPRSCPCHSSMFLVVVTVEPFGTKLMSTSPRGQFAAIARSAPKPELGLRSPAASSSIFLPERAT